MVCLYYDLDNTWTEPHLYNMPIPLGAESERPRHPIGVVAERTGLSVDTIRVWERRYGAVRPERDSAGQRIYSDADIERLRLLSVAARAGRSIGKIAHLDVVELEQLIAGDVSARDARAEVIDPEGDESMPDVVRDVMAATRAFDADAVESQLRRALARRGLVDFLEDIATPLLHAVGTEWHAGRILPASEHLLSHTLQDVVAESTRALRAPPSAPRFVAATLPGERHGIGATLTSAVAASMGWSVLYLGADVPVRDIATAAITYRARIVAISIVFVDDEDRVRADLALLRDVLPRSIELMTGGGGAAILGDDLFSRGVTRGATLMQLRQRLLHASAA